MHTFTCIFPVYLYCGEFLVRNTIINEIIDLDVGIFENVTASTIIIFLTKNTADLQNSISIKREYDLLNPIIKSNKKNLIIKVMYSIFLVCLMKGKLLKK